MPKTERDTWNKTFPSTGFFSFFFFFLQILPDVGLGLNPGLSGDRPSASRLIYCTCEI
jgi:hypothetical protein